MIPVFKKGDKLEVNNYRPISLISNIRKITEKLIHRRLNSILEQNNIFYPSQFGFTFYFNCDQGLLACGI